MKNIQRELTKIILQLEDIYDISSYSESKTKLSEIIKELKDLYLYQDLY